MERLFCYGTLEFIEIIEAVIGRVPSSLKAVLDGYCRYGVQGASYPAVIAEAGKQVSGTLYYPLTDKEILLLDAYEGSQYQRLKLPVITENSVAMDAMAYVIAPGYETQLTGEPWFPGRL